VMNVHPTSSGSANNLSKMVPRVRESRMVQSRNEAQIAPGTTW
jgi:hypothetical protein